MKSLGKHQTLKRFVGTDIPGRLRLIGASRNKKLAHGFEEKTWSISYQKRGSTQHRESSDKNTSFLCSAKENSQNAKVSQGQERVMAPLCLPALKELPTSSSAKMRQEARTISQDGFQETATVSSHTQQPTHPHKNRRRRKKKKKTQPNPTMETSEVSTKQRKSQKKKKN